MRMLAIALLGVVAAIAVCLPQSAYATRVTPGQANNICKGKPPLPNGGCAWCGKRNCTSVNCDEKACDVTIVSAGKKTTVPAGKVPQGELQTAPAAKN
jgi:hypothetical protein